MSFEALLAELEHVATADYETIIAAFRALPEVRKTADKGLLVRFFALMNGLLTFEPAQSRLLRGNFSTTDHIRACATEAIQKTLYERYRLGEALPHCPSLQRNCASGLHPGSR